LWLLVTLIDTCVHTAKTQPATFFAVCARLIGPEVKVTIEQSLPGNLSMEDWPKGEVRACLMGRVLGPEWLK
jgi:hypothetical protein